MTNNKARCFDCKSEQAIVAIREAVRLWGEVYEVAATLACGHTSTRRDRYVMTAANIAYSRTLLEAL